MTVAEPTPVAGRKLEMALVAAVALVYLGLCFYRDGTFIWLLRQSEGGMWLDEAVRMLHGELIYRDFFDFVAPGNVFLITAVLAAFGDGVATVGALVVGTGVLAALLVHAVGARLLPLPWRICATALFLAYAYQPYSPLNHKWPTLIFCLAGLLLVLPRRSLPRAAGAGLALAAATLSTQDMGAGAAAGLAAALWLLRGHDTLRPFIAFIAAYIGALGVALSVLAAAVGAQTLWYDLVVFPSQQYHNANPFSVDLGELHGVARTFSILGLCALGLGFAVVGIARRFWRTEEPAVVLVAIVGLGLLAGSLTRQIEPVSLGGRAVPALLAGLYLLRLLLRRWRAGWPALAFFAATLVPTVAVQVVHAQWTRPLTLADHRAGRIWEPVPMQDLAWLESRAAPGERVFLLPTKGGHSFLSRTRNALSFPMILDLGFNTDAQVAAASDELVARCPAIGLWDHGRFFQPAGKSALQPLYRRVLENYESSGRVPEDIELFVRKPGSGCATGASPRAQRLDRVRTKENG